MKTKILQDDGGLSFLGGFPAVEEVKVKFYSNSFIGSNCKTVTKTLTPSWKYDTKNSDQYCVKRLNRNFSESFPCWSQAVNCREEGNGLLGHLCLHYCLQNHHHVSPLCPKIEEKLSTIYNTIYLSGGHKGSRQPVLVSSWDKTPDHQHQCGRISPLKYNVGNPSISTLRSESCFWPISTTCSNQPRNWKYITFYFLVSCLCCD